MLRNLINNAIEAIDVGHPGQVTIDVDDSNPDHVDIRVSDAGHGIDDHVDLFAPFTTTKHHGLGLGLAVSRSLARSHGGDLFVASRGRGETPTCFVLRLPRRTLEGAAATIPPAG